MKLSDVFWAVLVISIVLGVLGAALHKKGAFDKLLGREPPHVRTILEFRGSQYLFWSNGAVTPHMFEERKFMLRALGAQTLMEGQESGSTDPPRR